MKEKVRDYILALIGVIVVPVTLLIEIISWLFRSKKEKLERKKYRKIKKEIIQKQKKRK
tara:strand:- start:271 stop:447 length:177 start_codon:yes stop_codon:yes gene_type:complete